MFAKQPIRQDVCITSYIYMCYTPKVGNGMLITCWLDFWVLQTFYVGCFFKPFLDATLKSVVVRLRFDMCYSIDDCRSWNSHQQDVLDVKFSGPVPALFSWRNISEDVWCQFFGTSGNIDFFGKYSWGILMWFFCTIGNIVFLGEILLRVSDVNFSGSMATLVFWEKYFWRFLMWIFLDQWQHFFW